MSPDRGQSALLRPGVCAGVTPAGVAMSSYRIEARQMRMDVLIH